jgi:alpha-N-arabinofuranosidase
MKNRNNLESAIAEAAYLTGLERNADVVRLASYAPLFAHADAWQWTPDLIWVNNLTVVATPNYYVQQLFSRNRGDQVLPARINLSAEPASGPANKSPELFASATRENAAGEIILKVVNAANSARDAEIRLEGVSSVGSRARVVVLTSASATAVNSFDQPNNVAPLESVIENASSHVNHTFPAHSLSVIRVPVKLKAKVPYEEKHTARSVCVGGGIAPRGGIHPSRSRYYGCEKARRNRQLLLESGGRGARRCSIQTRPNRW